MKMKLSKLFFLSILVVCLALSMGLAIAQDTNTGGMATYLPGGLVPTEINGMKMGINVDLSPGTGAPPSTLGGYVMTPVPYPDAPACTRIMPPLPVPGGGAIDIDPHDSSSWCATYDWSTWSHGYTGDVYPTGGSTSQTLYLPAGTQAVYFYVEPNPFDLFDFEAIAQPGSVSTGVFQADGSGGATYVGFYATGSDTIDSILINGATDFAVGEFGWAGGGTPPPECTEDDSGDLDLKGGSYPPGGEANVLVRVQGAPNAAYSMGLEVVFDASVLTYSGFTKGALVQDWSFFDVTNPEPGIIRIGGFTTANQITAGASGDLVILTFNVIDCDQGSSYSMGLQQLKNDIVQWSISGGCYDCGCSCDVNGDGDVTPGDALCAFQKYLGICPTACGPCDDICCDVNSDGDCTPGDALEIFKEYLGLESVCTTPIPIETRCQGQECGTYTFDCNPNNPDCICVKTAEGVPSGSCISGSTSCSDTQECTSSSECGSGEICAVDTCCGYGICIADNGCASGLEKPDLSKGSGMTISGR